MSVNPWFVQYSCEFLEVQDRIPRTCPHICEQAERPRRGEIMIVVRAHAGRETTRGRAAMPGDKTETKAEVDFSEVNKLIEALERDLEQVSSDSAAVQRLKDEVQTLKNVLGSPVRRHHWVRDGLHGVREAIDKTWDTAVADSLKASQYVSEIGRILGM
jgi:hypothetical protein